jgi:hypothetical protein
MRSDCLCTFKLCTFTLPAKRAYLCTIDPFLAVALAKLRSVNDAASNVRRHVSCIPFKNCRSMCALTYACAHLSSVGTIDTFVVDALLSPKFMPYRCLEVRQGVIDA